MGVKRDNFEEDVRGYSKKELRKHHDETLTRYIEDGGEVSVKVLSRVGKVPQSYVRRWIKEENWDQYLTTKREDLTQKTREFIKSAAEQYGLSEKEELFCYHFFRTKNATQAALRAGYGSHYSYNAAYHILQKDNVREFMKELQTHACEELFVSTIDILRMWAKIAFADMTDYVSVSGAGVTLRNSSSVDGQVITEVKEGRDGVTVKLADKMKALDRLSSYLKVLPGDKAQEVKLKILEKAADSNGDGDEPLKIEIVGV